MLAPVTIYGRAPPREAAAKDPAPAAKVGKDGEVVFEPDVIVGRAPGVSVEAGEGPDQTGPLGKMAPDDKRPPSATDLKHVDPDGTPKPKATAGEEGEAVVPEGEDEESERKPGAPVSKDDKVSEEGLPKPAAVAQQAAAPQPAAAAESGGVADLAAWRSRVSAATAATPRPTLGSAPVASVTVISVTGRAAGARHRAGGAAVAKDARKAVRPPPEVPKQLPPPPPTPVPAADKLITDASDKEMPEQKLPVLEQRAPDAAVPTMDTELASDIGSKIEIPPPEPKPELAPGEKKPLDTKQVKKLKDAKAKEPEPDKRAKPGQQMTLKDTAPKPTPGVEVGTKGQSRKKVALVLAELLRSPDAEAGKIVAESRQEAYPQSALEREYPALGEEKKDEVVTDLKTQVDQIRAIAGISADELDQAIKSREESLQKLAAGAKDAFADADKEAKEETKKSGEEAAEKIAGAREAIDEDTIQKMIAATGEADPEVVKLRRDKGLRDLSRRAARQDVYYEKTGERRIKALDGPRLAGELTDDLAALAEKAKVRDKIDKSLKLADWTEAQKALDDAGDALKAKIAKIPGADGDGLNKVLEEMSRTGRFNWDVFKETLTEAYPLEKQKFTPLRDIVEDLKKAAIEGKEAWLDIDVGPILHWGPVLEKLHGELDEAGQKALIKLVRDKLAEKLPKLSSEGYKSYRHLIRDKVMDHVIAGSSPRAQMKRFKAFMEVVRDRDNASIGEYFSAFRRKIFEGGEVRKIQGPLSGATNVKGASRQIDGVGEMVDGALEVPNGKKIPDGPQEGGRYLVEDKAGNSFDLDQARIYSDRLEKGTLKTADPEEVKGLIYFAEDPKHASRIVNKLDGEGLDRRIMVATFDEQGELCFLPRTIAPPPPPPPAELVKP